MAIASLSAKPRLSRSDAGAVRVPMRPNVSRTVFPRPRSSMSSVDLDELRQQARGRLDDGFRRFAVLVELVLDRVNSRLRVGFERCKRALVLAEYS